MTSSPVVPFDSVPAESSSGRGIRKIQSTVIGWEGNPEDLGPGMIPLADFPIRKGRSIKIKGENNTVIDILSMDDDSEVALESTDITGPSDGEGSQPSSSRGVKGYQRMPSRSAALLSRVASLMNRGSPRGTSAEARVQQLPEEQQPIRASFDGPANLASATLLKNMDTSSRQIGLLPSHSTNRSTMGLNTLSKRRLSAISSWVPNPETHQSR